MDKVSELLKEAKPLYFQEKRRKKQLKVACGLFILFLGFGIFGTQQYFDNNSNIISYKSGSIIEKMGLPTDEYGFLKVD